MKKTVHERFIEKYIPVTESGCWLWTGAASAGYGWFWNGNIYEGAHRYSYSHHIGPIPSGMNVLHRCDVSLCVNPDHLFTGTQKENVTDCISKGRFPEQHKGWDSDKAKLSDEDIRVIRWIYSNTGTIQRDIAITYNVHQSIISRAINSKKRFSRIT